MENYMNEVNELIYMADEVPNALNSMKGPATPTSYAMQVTLDTLKSLADYITNTDAKLDYETRIQMCALQVGFIKQTKKHGNTSVSMGFAKRYFEEQKRPGNVIFLNCGTGSAKIQLYEMTSTGIIRSVKEDKQDNGFSVNGFVCGKYIPKGNLHDAHSCKMDLLTRLAKLKENLSYCPVYAFVTGKVREHYEIASNVGEMLAMNLEMNEFFKNVADKPPGEASYFLGQQSEGCLELLGVTTMYKNLSQDGLLATDTGVVATLGIGRGSCQWSMINQTVVEHHSGMNDLSGLTNLPKTILQYWDQHPESYLQFVEECKKYKHPVIALKSGCLLELEKNQEIRNLLLKQPLMPMEPPKLVRQDACISMPS